MMATCWYCEKRSAAQWAAYKFKMHQHVPPYRSITVSVPRCEECRAIHGRIQRSANRMAVVFFTIPTLLCLLLLLLRSILARRLPWGIAVAIAAVTGALILGITTLWERRMLRVAGTKYARRALHAYPKAEELKQDGWKHAEKLRRPAVSETPKRPMLDPLSCAACGTQWSRTVGEMTRGSQRYVHGTVQTGSSQYAGICPKCRKAYCARCARTREAGSGVKISQCPDCHVDLLASLSD
jgi:hypothetical protein